MESSSTRTQTAAENNKEKATRIFNFRFWSVFFILVVPSTILLLSPFFCKQHCKKLPVYFNEVTEKGDTIEHHIPHFAFENQAGQVITHDSMRGNITVVDFFFTTCPGICKTLSSEMQQLQEKVKDIKDIKLISFTVDPQVDSVPVLADYAKLYKAIPNKWHFLTSRNDSVLYDVIKKGFKAPVYVDPKGVEKVTHSPMFYLVDKDLRIRAFVDMTQDTGRKKILELIDVLRCEYRNTNAKN
ncbi:MAG: SCO family protein [Bacteroidia bacterium]|nr:SCO family protein [Bacteroidia bacterium]MDW8157858.1 SCO family protein [Bacteroidia bacterium]